jgi:hypothetical protein
MGGGRPAVVRLPHSDENVLLSESVSEGQPRYRVDQAEYRPRDRHAEKDEYHQEQETRNEHHPQTCARTQPRMQSAFKNIREMTVVSGDSEVSRSRPLARNPRGEAPFLRLAGAALVEQHDESEAGDRRLLEASITAPNTVNAPKPKPVEELIPVPNSLRHSQTTDPHGT